jgi:hypothetical protein
MYRRLLALRSDALDRCGVYAEGGNWERYVAALFSMVPAFSISPTLPDGIREQSVVLAIRSSAPGASYWATYLPLILVVCGDLSGSGPEQLAQTVAAHAAQRRIRLAVVLTSGVAEDSVAMASRCSGTWQETTVVLLDDAEVLRLLQERRGLEPYLRDRVLNARLRKIGP